MTPVEATRRRPDFERPELPVVAVVVPAYQAAAHIQDVLAGIPRFVTHIIVVDDASPDDTAERVQAWKDERVRLIRHEVNQGVGGAVLSGYDAAVELGAEIIVKMDADNQMDPAYLLPLIMPIVRGQADYTKGNRFLHARQLSAMPALRRIGNAGLSFLTKIASGYWKVFDPTNGYTAIHASVLSQLSRDNIDRRYFFETSMLIELGNIRAVVCDVYIPAKYNGETSHLSEWSALVSFPGRLLRAFAKRIIIEYYIRDFTAVSLFLICGALLSIFGWVWGLVHWYISIATGVPASTGTVMLAVVPVILGAQFLLQAVSADVASVPTRPRHLDAEDWTPPGG